MSKRRDIAIAQSSAQFVNKKNFKQQRETDLDVQLKQLERAKQNNQQTEKAF